MKKGKLCFHCGEEIGESWEEGWCNYGNITIGISCCSLEYLWEDRELDIGFEHPAMIESGYQEINLQWGSGYKFDSKERGYRLCWDCQRELMGLVGGFFRKDFCIGKPYDKQS